MHSSVLHIIHDNHFWLSPHRCIYWEEKKALIIADLHLGKSGHFRKSGIAVPQQLLMNDLHRLFHCIQYFKPEKLFIAGDMFHSTANKELDLFMRWRNDISHVQIHLIKGNHDILHNSFYTNAAIDISDLQLNHHPFYFVHDISGMKENIQAQSFYFSGHIHPGIVMYGGSRQSLRFPCFYFTENYAVLPAFSAFAGYCIVRPKKKDKVFALVKDSIMEMQ